MAGSVAFAIAGCQSRTSAVPAQENSRGYLSGNGSSTCVLRGGRMERQSNPLEEPQMADTPTFGRYAEIPYDQMTPEQQDGYRSLIATRGQLGGPSRIWVHNPKLAKAAGPLGAH